jgi:hypothetical protein
MMIHEAPWIRVLRGFYFMLYFWPLPLHELHFWMPFPLQKVHLKSPFKPLPLQKLHSNAPVPEPSHDAHTADSASLAVASIVSAKAKMLRRVTILFFILEFGFAVILLLSAGCTSFVFICYGGGWGLTK